MPRPRVYASNAERQAAYRARRAGVAAAAPARTRPQAPESTTRPAPESTIRPAPESTTPPAPEATIRPAPAGGAGRAEAMLPEAPPWSRLSQELAAALTQAAVIEGYVVLLARRLAQAPSRRTSLIGRLPARL